MEDLVKQRFCLLLVEQDIFGDWLLKRIFGSLRTYYMRIIMHVFLNQEQDWLELAEIEYKKRQRGYLYADYESIEHFMLRPQNLSEINYPKPTKVE
jgi:hypothetical protein